MSKQTFGNLDLAKKMVQKFGKNQERLVKVKMDNIEKIQRFAASIERAHKNTSKSTLNFR
jgi:hypothetical protein